MTDGISVVHVLSSLGVRHGGPSRSVMQLTGTLAAQGLGVVLVSQRHREDAPPAGVGATDLRVPAAGWSLELALGLPVRRELQSIWAISKADLLHGHGIWQAPTHWLARAARKWQVPLVVQPRGMLEPWSVSQKALKKQMAMALFQRRDLESAAAFVATSEMEAKNLRVLGLKQPIAVIPNGVDFRLLGHGGAVGTRAAQRTRVALFLSRVHPKKGVRELITAWGSLAPAGWVLRIAGPDECGHWAEMSALVAKLGLAGIVQYLGPVEDAAKAALYGEADLFVLPTFSENFGTVVAEALACRVPVITTRGAPWSDLETYGCGWWIDTDVAALQAALRAATALTDEVRQCMGERGRAYVQRYKWQEVAAQTAALYRWLLGRGDRPACVRLD